METATGPVRWGAGRHPGSPAERCIRYPSRPGHPHYIGDAALHANWSLLSNSSPKAGISDAKATTSHARTGGRARTRVRAGCRWSGGRAGRHGVRYRL